MHTQTNTRIYIYIYIGTFVDEYCRIMCIHKHICMDKQNTYICSIYTQKRHSTDVYLSSAVLHSGGVHVPINILNIYTKTHTPQTSIYPPPYSTVAASTCRLIYSIYTQKRTLHRRLSILRRTPQWRRPRAD